MPFYAIARPNEVVTFVSLLTPPAQMGSGAPGDYAYMRAATDAEIATLTTPSPQAQLLAKLQAGIALTSTATPALDATYALDMESYGQIFQIGTYCQSFEVFPNGASTFQYPDAEGEPHTFAVADFVAFLKAVAPLVAAIQTQGAILAAGGTPTWPPQTGSIP